MRQPGKLGFRQEYGNCEVHGKYKLNKLDEHGREYWVPMCPSCRRLREVKGMLEAAEIPARFAACSFDNYQTSTEGQARALKQCRGYVEHFAEFYRDGVCLILRGNPGTGKNHLVTAIARELIQQKYSVLRVKAQEFLEAYWAKSFEDRQPWIKMMGEVDLLILDELGRSAQTKGAEDAFFRLLDARYEAQRPTALLSNLTGEQFRAVLGDAAYDRLRQGGGKLINFDWESWRG